MAITLDALSESAILVGTGGGDVFTWSHTTTTALRRAMVIGIATTGPGVVTITQVDYSGQILTAAGSLAATDSTTGVLLYTCIDPQPGTHTVTITVGVSTENYRATAITFSGVHQATAFSSVTTAEGADSTNPTVVHASAVDEMVVDVFSIRDFNAPDGDLTVGAGQTQQRYSTWIASDLAKYGMSTEPGAASVTMSWTNGLSAPTGGSWTAAAIAVKPFVAATNTTNFSPFVGIATIRQWVMPLLWMRAFSANYRTAMQWQPPAVWALNFGYHDPNPPITLENPVIARRHIAPIMAARRRKKGRRCAWLLPLFSSLLPIGVPHG